MMIKNIDGMFMAIPFELPIKTFLNYIILFLKLLTSWDVSAPF